VSLYLKQFPIQLSVFPCFSLYVLLVSLGLFLFLLFIVTFLILGIRRDRGDRGKRVELHNQSISESFIQTLIHHSRNE
jgi:hypothetical protein